VEPVTEATLLRAIRALEEVQDHLVVVGGTAHRLFPLHPLGRDPGFALLATEDVDFAAPLELQRDGSHQLLDRLREAGFEEKVRGTEEPAFIYPLRGQETTYLQFIANLTGSGRKRSGDRDRLMRFSGICAEKLRHVDVLLHATWDVSLEAEGTALQVRVANPSAYLVQKLLTLEERIPAKRAKDLLYIFDTIAIFSESLSQLGDQAETLVPMLSRKARKKITSAAAIHCFTEGATAREAAKIAQDQRQLPPTATKIVAACALGMRRILPDLLRVAS